MATSTAAPAIGMRELARRAPGAIALAVMALAGLAISVYLTVVHYNTAVTLVCNTNGLIDCGAVTTSAYSYVPGTQLPITLPGLLWFLASGVLALVALADARRGRSEPRWLRPAHALLGVAGLVFVLYLIYAEIVVLHRLCEWCTVVHLLTLGTFLIALYRLQRAGLDTETHQQARSRPAHQPTALRTSAVHSGTARHAAPRRARQARR